MSKVDSYLTERKWKPEMVDIALPPFIERAKSKPGFTSACVPMQDQEGIDLFGEGSYVVLKKWVVIQGLQELFEENLARNQDAPVEDEMDIRQAMNSDVPETPKVPEVPKAEEPKEERKFDKYVARVDYLKELGLEYDTSAKGYVNKERNCFVDANIIKNFESDTDKQFVDFVQSEMAKQWQDPLEQKVEETVEENVPDVAAGLDEKVPEETKEEVYDSEDDIADRKEWLKEQGFEMNPRTYRWTKGNIFISDAEASAPERSVWERFLEKYEKESEVLENVETESKPVEEVEEIQKEDVEAAADKFDEMVKETSVETIEDDQEEEEEGGMGLVDAVKDYRENHDEGKVVVPSAFFKTLFSYPWHKLDMTFIRKSDKVVLTMTPGSEEEDSAFKDIPPMVLTGIDEDFDKHFFEELDRPMKAVTGLFLRSDEYLKAIKKAEKEAKMVKDKKEKIDKAVKAAEDYAKKDGGTKKTEIKKWNEVLELDPNNKKAKDALAKLGETKLDLK